MESKFLVFNGSPHTRGNTALALNVIEDELQTGGIKTERIQLGGLLLHGCMGCRKCWENQDRRCVISSDPINGWIEKMMNVDGIVIGSPVYTANITPEVKILIDRVNFVAKANGYLLKGKIGIPIIVGTKAGMMPAYQAIMAMFEISQMVVMGSTHWNLANGKLPGDVLQDEEGLNSIRTVGRNAVELLRKLKKRN